MYLRKILYKLRWIIVTIIALILVMYLTKHWLLARSIDYFFQEHGLTNTEIGNIIIKSDKIILENIVVYFDQNIAIENLEISQLSLLVDWSLLKWEMVIKEIIIAYSKLSFHPDWYVKAGTNHESSIDLNDFAIYTNIKQWHQLLPFNVFTINQAEVILPVNKNKNLTFDLELIANNSNEKLDIDLTINDELSNHFFFDFVLDKSGFLKSEAQLNHESFFEFNITNAMENNDKLLSKGELWLSLLKLEQLINQYITYFEQKIIDYENVESWVDIHNAMVNGNWDIVLSEDKGAIVLSGDTKFNLDLSMQAPALGFESIQVNLLSSSHLNNGTEVDVDIPLKITTKFNQNILEINKLIPEAIEINSKIKGNINLENNQFDGSWQVYAQDLSNANNVFSMQSISQLPVNFSEPFSHQQQIDVSLDWQIDRYQYGGIDMQDSIVDITGKVILDNFDQYQLLLHQPSHIKITQMGYEDYYLNNMDMPINNINYDSVSQQLAFDTVINAETIDGPTLSANNNQLTIKGELLDNLISSELNLSVAEEQLTVKGNMALDISTLDGKFEYELADLYFTQGSEFIKNIIKDWPPLLTLFAGKMSTNGKGVIRASQLDQLSANVFVDNLSGVYDIIEFNDFNQLISMSLSGDQFLIEPHIVTVKTINPGVELIDGSVKLEYRSVLPEWNHGKLQVDYLSFATLGGELTGENIVIDFSKERNDFELMMESFDIEKILALQTNTEISGSGLLDGKLPLSLINGQFALNQGFVAARKPGGLLQYKQNEQATTLAANNSSMDIVLSALDNFQYDVLESNVNYSEGGKLLLGVKLQGKNPNYQQGQPINFNINLEQDLQGLLLSLQLTNQVSDIVKQRIQDYYQQQSN